MKQNPDHPRVGSEPSLSSGLSSAIQRVAYVVEAGMANGKSKQRKR